TIKTSLKQGGAIDFQYLQLKESRQYLFLIDVSTQNNHRTKILDYFIKALQKEDAPIEYFLFDKDPRSCWNDKSPEGISLKHLAHIYQSHQLILCSDGKVLLNAESENLVNWIKIFDAWRKKLLLTPKVYKDWNIKEQTLSEKFRMLPCTPNGITYLVDALESVEALDYEKLGYSQEEEVYQNITIPSTWQEEQLIRYLEAEFVKAQNGKTDDTLLRWIAACSIPPILFWQWTFYIGQLLSDSINNRLSLEHLFQIARISWFSEGKMPEQVRLILINWLEKKYPDWLDSLRKEWNSILNLEENLPPPNSVAWDGHRIEVILNQLLQNSSWRKKRALELELDRLMLGQKDQDAMVIQYLKKRYDALEAVLSNRFRQFIQKKENLFWRFRMWVWQVPVFLILLLSSVLTHYSVPVTTFKFNNYISAMTFSEDGESFFVANGRGGLAVCETNGEWKQGLAEQKSSILALSNGIDDNQIQAGFSDNTIVHWDISGVPLLLYKNEERLIRDVAFHPNNDKIALLAFAKNRAELWNIKTNELLLTLQHSENVTHA
ncbi:MAG: WD40 repeat domain-containing protein, partial [Bacteroidota bacterium]